LLEFIARRAMIPQLVEVVKQVNSHMSPDSLRLNTILISIKVPHQRIPADKVHCMLKLVDIFSQPWISMQGLSGPLMLWAPLLAIYCHQYVRFHP
jgi:hypothetical protein